MSLPDIEIVAAKVHDAWWREKKKQGFHSPVHCGNRPETPQDFQLHPEGFPNEIKFQQYCERCHTDMYHYEELPEQIKEYDRVTVRAVYAALKQLGMEEE